MGREIKFRGLSINGEWVYGNLSILKKKVNNIEAGSYISNSMGLPFAYQIRPETGTQYTGLHDKNNKEIYEGDILKVKYPETDFQKEEIRNEEVYYEGVAFFPLCYCGDDYEVIGNIWENPVLSDAKAEGETKRNIE